MRYLLSALVVLLATAGIAYYRTRPTVYRIGGCEYVYLVNGKPVRMPAELKPGDTLALRIVTPADHSCSAPEPKTGRCTPGFVELPSANGCVSTPFNATPFTESRER